MLSEIWIYKKNEKIFLVMLFLLLVVIGCLNWMLGLLTAIVIIGFVIVIEKNDYKQERILLNYLDELSAGVEAGTIYAVKNLPLGISLMDEKRQFVWANGVFRSWLKADIEEDNRLKMYSQACASAKSGERPDGLITVWMKNTIVCFTSLFRHRKKTGRHSWPFIW